MMDNSEEFVYRRDGAEAEVVVYAPDAEDASRGFERAVVAASLPGARSPVFAVSSAGDYGYVVVSGQRVAPALASEPYTGILLSTETSLGGLQRSLGGTGAFLTAELERRMMEGRISLPRTGASVVREACEVGAESAAGLGIIEEEDLGFMPPLSADPDSVGRRSIALGERESDFFDHPPEVTFLVVGEILDRDAVEAAGIGEGDIVVLVRAGARGLGRSAFDIHQRRAAERVMRRVYDPIGERTPDGLHAFPHDSEEAEDFLLASGAASNFADWRTCVGLHVVRRVLGDVLGEVGVISSWRVGGAVRLGGGDIVHRSGLAAVGEGGVIACTKRDGSDLCTGMGTMYGSIPPFAVHRGEAVEHPPMEEAGLLGTWARLEIPGVSGGEV